MLCHIMIYILLSFIVYYVIIVIGTTRPTSAPWCGPRSSRRAASSWSSSPPGTLGEHKPGRIKPGRIKRAALSLQNHFFLIRPRLYASEDGSLGPMQDPLESILTWKDGATCSLFSFILYVLVYI